MGSKLLSLAGLALAVAGFVSLLVTGHVLGAGPVAIAVQVLSVGLLIWARVTFGLRSYHATANPTAGGVVSSGPYRYWRHPIYDSLLYFSWAGILSRPSWDAAAAGAAITLGLVTRMLLEERLMRERYPEYADYMARTRRFVPFVF